ncbi:unnamed protein product, partial [Discosporangium mesarthrocarpum]
RRHCLRYSARQTGRVFLNLNPSAIPSELDGGVGKVGKFQLPPGSPGRLCVKQKILSTLGNTWRRSEHDADIFALAIPTLGAVLIDPFLSLVDTCYVGWLGAESLAAIGSSAAAFNFIFSTASCVFMVPTAVSISESRAKKDKVAVGRSLTLASSLSVLLGLGLGCTFCAQSAPVLSLMGAEASLMDLATPYFQWRALAMPANLFLLMMCCAVLGLAEPKTVLKLGLLIGAVNAVLNPVLMFSCGMGITGAAIATVASQWVGVLAFGFRLWVRREELGLGGKSSIPGVKELRSFANASGAMFFRQLCNIGTWTLMASAANRMGVLENAAHQLILSLWLVIAFVQDALGSAGQVLVAKYLGKAREALQEETRRQDLQQDGDGMEKGNTSSATATEFQFTARSIANRVLGLSFSIGVFLASISLAGVPFVLPLMCRSQEVVDIVSQVFPHILRSFPLCCIVWTWDSLFYGASDYMYNAKAVFSASALGVAGTLLSLWRGWGIKGLWITMTYVFFGVRVVAHLWRFNSPLGPFGP